MINHNIFFAKKTYFCTKEWFFYKKWVCAGCDLRKM